ncbi:MAG: hypothetical protein GJ676_18970 [Rhodobacteraceae bacterium]|nr:hypothetical protein [Paracoccaceae bacterium]
MAHVPFAWAADGASNTPPQRTGLLWNKTGLPAVFPLQIKTDAGTDYVLTLIAPETGEEKLAAYIIGGAFFRVLVPPGSFMLRFTPEGEDATPFELAEPLTFRTRGHATKSGHQLDLTGLSPEPGKLAQVKSVALCQIQSADYGPQVYRRADEDRLRAFGQLPKDRPFDRLREKAREEFRGERLVPGPYVYDFSGPRFAVRTVFCE